jgi:hypothetical protein
VATRGLTAGDDYTDHGLELGGRKVEIYIESFLTPVFNLFIRCPVLKVPPGSLTTSCRPASRSWVGPTTI